MSDFELWKGNTKVGKESVNSLLIIILFEINYQISFSVIYRFVRLCHDMLH